MIAAAAAAQIDAPERSLDVLRIELADLPMLAGAGLSRLRLYACDSSVCAAIVHQVDERDAAGQWVLTGGPAAHPDDPPDQIDSNDVLFIAAADAGMRFESQSAPRVPFLAAIEIRDPLSTSRAWVYVALAEPEADPAPPPALQYDAARDLLRGGGIAVGYSGGVPAYLSIGDGANLLDRLKIRASARFLWFRFERSEADLSTELLGWKLGPLRIIRAQMQRVRLGWGIRSPAFVSYIFYHRGFAELPLSLRLNFPPTYFFSDIRVQAFLDFRDLRGWQLLLPGRIETFAVDGVLSAAERGLTESADPWFGLIGPRAALTYYMGVSSSLRSVRQRLVYRDDATHGEAPESAAGELPAIGYELDRWQDVGAGNHALQASAYLVPAGADIRRFMLAQQDPLRVTIHFSPEPGLRLPTPGLR